MPAEEDRRPFGARRDAERDRREAAEEAAAAAQQPVPVLHVGEVHAELRLHITEETLHDLGSQIATMIANAAAQGFQTGLEVGMARAAGDDDEMPSSPGGLTEEDFRRARGE